VKKDFPHLTNLFEPVAVVDGQNKIIYSNNYFSTFFKAPPRKVKEMATLLDAFASTENIKLLLSSARETQEIQITKEVEISLKTENVQTYRVVIRAVPLSEENVLVCFHDLTVESQLNEKYKEKMKELKETHQQILQADKLSTLGELTAGISHEIANPLMIASGSVDLLQALGEVEDMNKAKKAFTMAVEDLVESLDRINSIITNMKNFLHTSDESKEYCSLNEIVQKAVHFMQPSFNDAKVKLVATAAPKDFLAMINPLKIEQVLVNLMSNALDAVTESKKEEGLVQVTLSETKNEGNLKITVQDNGVGIKAENKDKIFETFFTTKDIGAGTGLGLAISQKIMENHQGTIEVDSSEGLGTTFSLTFPAIETSSILQNDLYLGGRSSVKGKKVLVIDNEVKILNILNKILESELYTFVGSTSGEDALKLLRNADVDLIITDYEMPGLSGKEFAEKVRAEKIKTPIMYLTAEKYLDAYKKEREELGLAGIILKPFTKEELLNSINSVLGLTSDEDS
jgi:signal transduction histidine kinase